MAGIDKSNIVYIHAPTKKDFAKQCSGGNYECGGDGGDCGGISHGMNEFEGMGVPLPRPAGLAMENLFTHNTKITSSALNEQKDHKLHRG
jgi:hypothetical protein